MERARIWRAEDLGGGSCAEHGNVVDVRALRREED